MTLGSKQIGIIIVILLILVGWFVYRTSLRHDINNLDSRGTSIVAFGDSLVQGVGSTPNHDFISLLSQRIGEPIVNLGKSGDTTTSALTRIDTIFQYNPKLVIVLLGGNDFLRRVPKAETFKNLATIISTIQSHGAAVLVLGIRGGLLTDEYNDSFEDLAETYQTGFVSNVLAGLLGDRAVMFDQIHPNDAGYVKIADKVLPVLKRMLSH